jgi:hypothetical protein
MRPGGCSREVKGRVNPLAGRQLPPFGLSLSTAFADRQSCQSEPLCRRANEPGMSEPGLRASGARRSSRALRRRCVLRLGSLSAKRPAPAPSARTRPGGRGMLALPSVGHRRDVGVASEVKARLGLFRAVLRRGRRDRYAPSADAERAGRHLPRERRSGFGPQVAMSEGDSHVAAWSLPFRCGLTSRGVVCTVGEA